MTMTIDASEYTSLVVCELADITYRQLSYWCTVGHLTPSVSPPNGSGSRSIYSFEDVQIAVLLGRASKYLGGGGGSREFSGALRQVVDSARTLIRSRDGYLPKSIFIVFRSDWEVIATDHPVDDLPYFHCVCVVPDVRQRLSA